MTSAAAAGGRSRPRGGRQGPAPRRHHHGRKRALGSRRGLPRVAGHKAGAEAVRRAMQAAVDNGVEVLTLYAFSSENWRRSNEEIADLTGLMRFYLERELAALQKEGVRLRLIGDYSAFGPDLVARLERAVEHTAEQQAADTRRRAQLWFARGNRQRPRHWQPRQKQARSTRIRSMSRRSAGAPDPRPSRARPLIRTSGEIRLRNFLLWQAAYAELMFVDTWPDFEEQAFAEAID